MGHIPTEKIAILDFSTGDVIISPISEREEAEEFFKRKGLRESDIQWMRGNIRVCIENEEDNRQIHED